MINQKEVFKDKIFFSPIKMHLDDVISRFFQEFLNIIFSLHRITEYRHLSADNKVEIIRLIPRRPGLTKLLLSL